MSERNNCRECPYSKPNPQSSHHLACHHPIFANAVERFKFALALLNTPTLEVTATPEDGEPYPLLKFNPRSVQRGWCNYPIDFDPIWVDCRLPLILK